MNNAEIQGRSEITSSERASRNGKGKDSRNINGSYEDFLRTQERSASPALRKRKFRREIPGTESSEDEEVVFTGYRNKRKKMSQSDGMEFGEGEEQAGSQPSFTTAFFTNYMEENVTSKFNSLENRFADVGEKLSGLSENVARNGGRLMSLEHRVQRLETGGGQGSNYPALPQGGPVSLPLRQHQAAAAATA